MADIEEWMSPFIYTQELLVVYTYDDILQIVEIGLESVCIIQT